MQGTPNEQFKKEEIVEQEIPEPSDSTGPSETVEIERDGVTAQNVERLTGMITERGRFQTR